MTNAEKYPNTKDALEAYRKWRKNAAIGNGIPFDYWLGCEYVESEPPTLLEAAENLIIGFVNTWSEGWSSMECLENLRKAVKREKQKPIRNCDRYKTGEKAQEAFNSICRTHGVCSECQVRAIRKCCGDENTQCQFLWLYAEAEAKKEEKNADA